jgi:hypothetical protein
MAISVLVIIADEIPCRKRTEINMVESVTNAHAKVVMAKIIVPYKNIFVLPKVSPNFPKGTRKITDASKYDIETQLKPMADIEKSVPIFFRATLTAAPIKGLKKWVAIVATSKMFRLTPVSEIFFVVILNLKTIKPL